MLYSNSSDCIVILCSDRFIAVNYLRNYDFGNFICKLSINSKLNTFWAVFNLGVSFEPHFLYLFVPILKESQPSFSTL